MATRASNTGPRSPGGALLALAVFAPALPAQQADRELLVGTVRDASGQPLRGAEARALFLVHPAVDEPRYRDHIVATTDERGRFKMMLRAGMPYSLWARASLDGGSTVVSMVARDVVAGMPITLIVQEERVARRVRITWPTPDDGDWSVTACFGAGAMSQFVPLAFDPDGTTLVPVGFGSAALEIARNGFVVARRGVPQLVEPKAPFAGGPLDVVVPPLREVAVRILDETGEPAPGVEWTAEARPRRVVGRSGFDGLIRAEFGSGDRDLPDDNVLLGGDRIEARLERGLLAQVEACKPLEVRLPPGRSVHGRLLLGAQRPLAGVPLLLHASIAIDAASAWFGVGPRVLRSGDDGRFVVPGRSSRFPFRVSALLDAAAIDALTPPDANAPLWPIALLLPENAGEISDPGDVVLSRLRMLAIEVVAADGAPPGSVRLVVSPAFGDASQPFWPEIVRTDRRGRVRWLASSSSDYIVFAATPAGGAWTLIEGEAKNVSVTLDPAHVVRLRLRGSDGRPLAGSWVRTSAAQPLPDAPLPDAVVRAADSAFPVNAFPLARGRSDADGRVDLVAPFPNAVLHLSVSGGNGESAELRLAVPREPGADPIDVKLGLRAGR